MRAFIGAAFILSVQACTVLERDSKPAPKSFAEPAAAEVIAVGFNNITDKYIEPVQIDRLGVEGLRGLGAIDAGLSLTEDAGTLVMYEHDHEIGRMAMPADTDIRGWADAIVAMTENARAHSREIGGASAEKIYEAIFDGVLSDLDIFSRYAGSTEATRNRARRDGFGGIGIRFRTEAGSIVVTKVLEDTPAHQSGIRPGDIILKVEGHSTADLDSTGVTRLIRGPVHTEVRLTLTRTEAVRPFEISVARAHIVPQTVTARVEDGLGIIAISSFNQETGDSLERTLAEMMAPDAPLINGLILDLRGNPGGLLRQSIQVADLLLTQGDILRTNGRHPDSLHHYEAGGRDLAVGKPVVVLIDGKSASAAEIVAAALQDRDRAVVVGTSSYGKGSVQTVIRLPNDGEITLTWSKFVAPSGYQLHGLGVVPTVCTSGKEDLSEAAALLEVSLKDTQSNASSWRNRALLKDSERQALRSGCPSERRNSPLDLEVAKRLLLDQQLHARALRLTTATAHATN